MKRGCLIPLFLLACGGDETTNRDTSSDTSDADTATGDASDASDGGDNGDAADGTGDVAPDSPDSGDSGDSGDTGDIADATAGDADAVEDTGESIDTTLPDGFPTLCRANRLEECDYAPTESYEVTTTRFDDIEYEDVLGHPRLIDVVVYLPDAPGPRPVVLLSHGGNHGQTDPRRSAPDLAERLAAAGYVAIGIAHTGRQPDDQTALCAALEVPSDIVCNVTVNWDIPHDVTRIIDWLEAPPEALDGHLDLARVVHLGQAEGAGAVLMELGATRNFRCPSDAGGTPSERCPLEGLVGLREPRIDLGIVLSAPGPGVAGFLNQSYGNVRAPVLLVTGASDLAGAGPAAPLSLWPLLPMGGKFKLYLDHGEADMAAIADDLDQCTLAGTTCDDMRLSVESAVLAFVDAFVRDEILARAWLASKDAVTLSHGLASWERR